MKKAKSPKQAAPKRRAAPKNMPEYFARVPQPARGKLRQLRAAIRSVMPAGAAETISYGIPAFKRKKGVLVWFAAFADHCSLFPTAAVIDAFKNELTPYSTSKGTVHFPLDRPLPIALIKKMVKARVSQIASR